MSNEDHGKFRSFTCECGVQCCRPLTGDVKDCDHCGRQLLGTATIEDHLLFVRRLLALHETGGP